MPTPSLIQGVTSTRWMGLPSAFRPVASPGPDLRKSSWSDQLGIFVEDGYEGNRDNYFDPRNSYLNEVMDRKKGIPISLSVLYGSVAERLGLVLQGTNLPAAFHAADG